MTRAILRRLAISAVLGVATTILVTAWCVYAVSTRGRFVYSATFEHEVMRHHSLVLDTMLAQRPGKAVFTWRPSVERIRARPGVDTRPPSWSTIDLGEERRLERELVRTSVNDGGHLRWSTRTDIAYGWPMLSFRGGFTANATSGEADPDFGPMLPIIRTSGPGGTSGEPRAVPLAPIFPGVLVNSAVYGVVWWAVLFVRGPVRRWRRRRRGACLESGYDRRGIGVDDVCPECGTGDAGRRSAAPPARAGGSD